MALARLGGDDGSEAVEEDVLEQVPQYILVGCKAVGAAMLKFHRFAGLAFAELDGIGAYQGCRAGAVLLQEAEEASRQGGCAAIFALAVPSVVGFYTRLAYANVGDSQAQNLQPEVVAKLEQVLRVVSASALYRHAAMFKLL